MISQTSTCDPNEITCTEDPPDDSSLVADLAGVAVDAAGELTGASAAVEVTGDLAGAAAGAAIEATAGAAVEALNASLEDQAAASFVRFQEELSASLFITTDLLDNPLSAPFRGTVGAIAFTAIALALMTALFRGVGKLKDIGGPFITYLTVISVGGVFISAVVLISDQYLASTVAIDLGEPDMVGAGQAAIAAPFVLGATTVVFSARGVIIGALAVVWLVAAAVHLFSAARSAFALATALLLANAAWPVISILFVSKAFDSLPWIGETITWLFLAIVAPIATNLFAAAVISRKT